MSNVGGARLENSRDMQMPRYRSYRDTVGTEYIIKNPFKRKMPVEISPSFYSVGIKLSILPGLLNSSI